MQRIQKSFVLFSKNTFSFLQFECLRRHLQSLHFDLADGDLLVRIKLDKLPEIDHHSQSFQWCCNICKDRPEKDWTLMPSCHGGTLNNSFHVPHDLF